MDIYAHNFKSSGALENKYYATKKLLESGLLVKELLDARAGRTIVHLSMREINTIIYMATTS